MNFDKIIDLFMFRESSDIDNYTSAPRVTFGSIVWGLILRTTIVIIAFFVLYNLFDMRQYWWISFFVIWLFVAFPAFRQYQSFNNRIDNLQEEILCGSCKYFNKYAQTCQIYDEHVNKNYIPCEGLNWEPKDTFDNE